eukprot:s2733_g4.t1
MVYFMENPKQKWMMGYSTTFGAFKRPAAPLFKRRGMETFAGRLTTRHYVEHRGVHFLASAALLDGEKMGGFATLLRFLENCE